MPPIEPPIDLPRSAAICPATRLVTDRVISRVTICPVLMRWPRGRLVPKMTAEHAADLAEPAATLLRLSGRAGRAAVLATRFCSIS